MIELILVLLVVFVVGVYLYVQKEWTFEEKTFTYGEFCLLTLFVEFCNKIFY